MIFEPGKTALIIEWAAEFGQPFLLLGVFVSLIWNVAVCHTQFKHIRNNMVTKKDLELARQNLKLWAVEQFVTQKQCAERIVGLGAGSVHGK